jgi:hypothetical protein
VREITRKIDEQINSVRRELANLLSIGIISSENTNNKLYYEVDQKYEYFEPLSVIFGGGVMSAPKAPTPSTEATSIKSIGNIELAVYTGQFTRDESSGTDLLIVGDVNGTKLAHFISDLEKQEGKELRFTVMEPQEFKYRRQVNDRFLSILLNSKMQVIIDKQNILATNQES